MFTASLVSALFIGWSVGFSDQAWDSEPQKQREQHDYEFLGLLVVQIRAEGPFSVSLRTRDLRVG